jgi:hypothetical protein
MIIRNYISVGSPLLVRNSGEGEEDVGVVLQVPAKLWCCKVTVKGTVQRTSPLGQILNFLHPDFERLAYFLRLSFESPMSV